jgi:cysteinyl-tRNA synthetase
MERIEEYLLELQKEVEEGLYRYISDHFYTHYNYLLDNTKKFLRRSQRHILKLKGMLKEQEESNKTKLEEKEEQITRLKNEKEYMKVDDDIRKSFETIIRLKTQIEEAKRVEELLKNQINEKEESCDKLEAEILILERKWRSQINSSIAQKSWMRSWKVKDHHMINQVLDTKNKLHMSKKEPQRSMR